MEHLIISAWALQGLGVIIVLVGFWELICSILQVSEMKARLPDSWVASRAAELAAVETRRLRGLADFVWLLAIGGMFFLGGGLMAIAITAALAFTGVG